MGTIFQSGKQKIGETVKNNQDNQYQNTTFYAMYFPIKRAVYM